MAIAMLVMTAWLVAACGTVSPTPEPVSITLASASAGLPLAEDLVAAYEARFPQVNVIVQGTANSLTAETWARSGRADLAIITQPPQLSAQSPLTATQLAWESLAVIVNPANTVADLSLDQLQRLFSGRLQDWSELGQGLDLVQPMIREQGSGSRLAFDRAVLETQALAPGALIQPSVSQMATAVAQEEGAIGYLPAALLDERVRAVTVNGSAADARMGVATGYPLLLPIYLLVGQGSQAADDFWRFALGEGGQEAVDKRYGRLR